jgi:hypothetical protein
VPTPVIVPEEGNTLVVNGQLRYPFLLALSAISTFGDYELAEQLKLPSVVHLYIYSLLSLIEACNLIYISMQASVSH